MTVQEKAYAKLNLSLDVAGRRSDGYHEMVMLMQTVSVCDEVTLRFEGQGVRARSALRYIPGDERNLAVRAAKLFFAALGEKEPGLTIELDKRIPVGAGMGGGSADAAAVLRALHRVYEGRLDREELFALAGQVGSDVAFCLAGGTMLATGRGEELRALPPLPECAFVIAKPAFSISTPELFKSLDRTGVRTHPDTAGLLEALERGSLTELCRRMYNVFEDVDDRRLRTVRDIKGRLLDGGALAAVMTGTGSAVFGVFESLAAAERCRAAMAGEQPFVCTAEAVGGFAL